jgi:hypothetical protein
MGVQIPNPPLREIEPEQMISREDAAARWHFDPKTIDLWVKRERIEPLAIGGGGPQMFYLPALAEAEYDSWLNGAYRAWRGGRHPDWRPCRKVAA